MCSVVSLGKKIHEHRLKYLDTGNCYCFCSGYKAVKKKIFKIVQGYKYTGLLQNRN